MSTPNNQDSSADKATVTLPGTVEKIIPSCLPDEPDKAQISVEGAEDLYKELRVDNVLQDSEGKTVELKKGAEVQITIAADPSATKPTE